MISIITPTHKRVPLIEKTVTSVLSQTCSDYEWVVLDNSVDCYFEKYLDEEYFVNHKEYAGMRDKIRVFRKTYPDTNVGRIKNDLVGMTSCSDSEYVLLLDHDDFLTKHTVEKINEITSKYPEADYVTGDQVVIYYDIESDVFRIHDFSDDIDDEEMEAQDLEHVSGDVRLDIGSDLLDFGYCNNYTFRYYDKLYFGLSYEVNARIGESRRSKIKAHPRIVKKSVLKNPLFGFYEGHSLSEDNVQCVMLGIFCKGCYLEEPTVCNIVYSDAMNSSYMPVSADVYDSYMNMIYNIESFWEYYYKLFGCHIDTHKKFLNI